MHSIVRFLLAACAAGVVAGAEPAKAPKPPRLPEVLVVADSTGKPEQMRPAPGKPIHYIVLDGFVRDIGDPLPDLPCPPEEEVRRQLVRALASQGYVETQVGGPMPQLAIAFIWGTVNLVYTEGGEGAPDEIVRRQIRQVVGMEKADKRILAWWDADRLNFAFGDDRVYLMVFAFDAQSMARKDPQLLWRSRISLHWRDLKPESFEVMLASAAPFFGLDTDRGVFVDDRYRRATVEVGEATVVGEDVKAPAKEEAQSREETNPQK